MIKHTKPFPISEEMLGAYLEGNLAQHDARYIEQMLQDNDELSTFVNELSLSDSLMSNCRIEDVPSFENDFTLPEIPTEIRTFIEPHILPLEYEPMFDDVAVCALIPELTDDVDIITNENIPNTDVDNVLDLGADINNEDLSFDGEF